LEVLEEFPGLAGQGHPEVLGEVELVPVPVGGEIPQSITQAFEFRHVRVAMKSVQGR
jgi:hypothetical protein